MNLRESTKDLHHAAERHVVGYSMAEGTIKDQWWADWLSALYIIHSAIDDRMPPEMRRVQQIAQDLAECKCTPRPMFAALRYAQYLNTEVRALGAAYVFTGAHLMGGAITAKNIKDRLPTHHLHWEDRQQVVQAWKPLRERDDLSEFAMAGFQTVLLVMDEIVAHDGRNAR